MEDGKMGRKKSSLLTGNFGEMPMTPIKSRLTVPRADD